MDRPEISVIIPALNESGYLERTLSSCVAVPGVEVVVVDGGSDDGTAEIAERCGARSLAAPRGRANQLNAGAAEAGGRRFVFLHADTVLPPDFDEPVQRILESPGTVAGAFALRIDGHSKAIRRVERGVNWRARFLGMPYGDQAIFVDAETFRSVGGFPELPIMEDFELVRRLRRHGRIGIASQSVLTSPRRWERLGAVRTTWINQAVVVGYLAGVDPHRIADWYRRGRLSGS